MTAARIRIFPPPSLPCPTRSYSLPFSPEVQRVQKLSHSNSCDRRNYLRTGSLHFRVIKFVRARTRSISFFSLCFKRDTIFALRGLTFSKWSVFFKQAKLFRIVWNLLFSPKRLARITENLIIENVTILNNADKFFERKINLKLVKLSYNYRRMR